MVSSLLSSYSNKGIHFELGKDFQLDNTSWMFGASSRNNEKAMKKVGNHLKALNALKECGEDGALLLHPSLNSANRYPRMLSLPLTILVEYRGYKVLCYAPPPDPAFKSSYVSGLEYLQLPDQRSPRETFHFFSDALKGLASSMNLAPSTVMGKTVASSVEMEAFVGADSRYYLSCFWHLMPPEYPSSKEKQVILYNLLRPELVRNYPTPLCPNALTQWIANDPQKLSLESAVKEATERLHSVIIPEFARYLVCFRTALTLTHRTQ